jgi:hypothetical protein
MDLEIKAVGLVVGNGGVPDLLIAQVWAALARECAPMRKRNIPCDPETQARLVQMLQECNIDFLPTMNEKSASLGPYKGPRCPSAMCWSGEKRRASRGVAQPFLAATAVAVDQDCVGKDAPTSLMP